MRPKTDVAVVMIMFFHLISRQNVQKSVDKSSSVSDNIPLLVSQQILPDHEISLESQTVLNSISQEPDTNNTFQKYICVTKVRDSQDM